MSSYNYQEGNNTDVYYSLQKPNKYPVLLNPDNVIPKLQNITNINEEKKNNNEIKIVQKNNKIIKKNKNNFFSETDDMNKDSNRKLISDNLEPLHEIDDVTESRMLNQDVLKKTKSSLKIEENKEIDSEIQRKKQEELNNEYQKYEINQYKSGGNNTNIVNSLLPSKCIIVLRGML